MFWGENCGQVASPLTQWPRRPVVCWRTWLFFCLTGQKCLALGSVEEKSSSSLWIVTSQQAGGGIRTAGPPDTLEAQTRIFPGFRLLHCLGAGPEGGRSLGACGEEISTSVEMAVSPPLVPN